MSTDETRNPKQDLPPDVAEIVARAQAAGWPCDVSLQEEVDEDDDPYYVARLDVPNGRSHRRVVLLGEDFELLRNTDFENYRYLGDYQALVNTGTGEIEATVVSATTLGLSAQSPRLWRLPGAELLDGDSADGDETETEDFGRTPTNWRVQVTSDDGARELELSPASRVMRAFASGRRPSLKLRGFSTASEDDAIRVMEHVGQSYLFDLDVRYNMYLSFPRRRPPTGTFPVARLDEPPRFPKNAYLDAPLALYRYGRASTGLPLLQYLAFYQALEYFFPMFTREEVASRLKAEINDPRFSPASDESLSRLITLLAPAASGQIGEREQLRATIRACIDRDRLKDFISASDDYRKHFCDRRQSISGVNAVQLNPSSIDLRDQIADRIYAIRCRIVHTKQDGGGSGVDLLLPTSREAGSLPKDVDLVRMLAQRALVSRATQIELR